MTGVDDTKESGQRSDKGQMIVSPYFLHPSDKRSWKRSWKRHRHENERCPSPINRGWSEHSFRKPMDFLDSADDVVGPVINEQR